LVAVKALLPDRTLEYHVYTLAGLRLGTFSASQGSNEHVNEFPSVEQKIRGNYLAYFRPVPDSYDDWELALTYLDLRFSHPIYYETVLGSGSMWSEFALDESGKVLTAFTCCVGLGRHELLLHEASPSNGALVASEPESILSLEGVSAALGKIALYDNLALYEVYFIGAFGAKFQTVIVLTDVETLETYLIAEQAIPGQEVIITDPQISANFLSWLDGNANPSQPVIALRRLSASEDYSENYAIFPPKNGAITEYVLLENKIVRLALENGSYSVNLTEIR
jgi:hypothetical protein